MIFEISPKGESYLEHFTANKVVEFFLYMFPVIRVNGVIEFDHGYF